MKKLLLILAGAIACLTTAAQDTLLIESFETNGHGSRYTLNLTVPFNATGSPGGTSPGDTYPGTSDGGFYDGVSDYAMRTNDSDLGASFLFTPSGEHGTHYFAFEDTDDNGTGVSDHVFTMQFDNIDVTNYTDLGMSFKLASPRVANFDNGAGTINNWDSVAVFYRLDAGNWTKLAYFTGSQASSGSLQEDSDLNGTPDGNVIGTGSNCVFETVQKAIAGTGTTVDLLFAIDVNGGSEELALDYIKLWGTAAALPLAASFTSQTNLVCRNVPTGALTVTATGGTPPYSYSWNTGSCCSNQSQTNLGSNTWAVTVSDAAAQTVAISSFISQPPLLTASPTVLSNNFCGSTSLGALNANASGGTGAFTYMWDAPAGNQTSATATGLNSQSYNLTVTDNNGCTTTASGTVTTTPNFTALIAGSDPNCNAGSDGSASVTAGGGTTPYTYTWNVGGSGSTRTSLSAGTYTCTVSDADGCGRVVSVTLINPAALNATASITTPMSCASAFDAAAGVAASGGSTPYTYLWSNSGTAAGISNLTPGTYTATVTDNNGCTKSSSVVVTEPASLVGSAALLQNETCPGAADGTLTGGTSGGTTPYTYVWSNATTDEHLFNVSAGTYTVTITDANGCTETESGTVGLTGLVTASASLVTPVSCNGDADAAASVAASGGDAPYTYLWSTGSTSSGISSLAAGTYTATVTDDNGCTGSNSVSISDPATLTGTATVTSNESCSGAANGAVNTAVSGGTTPYTYSWSNAGSASAISSLAAGTYTVTVTDARGCTVTDSDVVGLTGTVTATASLVTPVSCNGVGDAAASVSASGGSTPYTYLWSTGSAASGISSLTAGTYTATVTDNNGCTGSNSVAISQPTNLVATSTVTSNETCGGANNGSINSNAAGGTTPYTFTWSNAATTANISGLPGGTYTLTVTDANGCTENETASVTVGATVVANASTASNAACNGESNGAVTAAPTGGTGPYTYLWSSGSSSNSPTGLAAATYTVTVTDNNGCTGSGSTAVTEPSVLGANVTIIQAESCLASSDGQVGSTPSGGSTPYTYLWSTGATSSSITGLTAGTYTVTVTDVVGCDATGSVTLAGVGGVASTQLRASSCGSTLPLIGSYIFVDLVPGADRYEYEISDGAGMLEEVMSLAAYPGSNFFSLSWVNGITTGVTYNVRVKARVGNCWGDYGATCQVSTPTSIPVTEIYPQYCGITQGALNDYFYIKGVAGATAYGYEVSDGAGFKDTVNSLMGYASATWFSLSFVPGIQYGTTYTVRVRANVAGVWGNFGASCVMTTPPTIFPAVQASYCGNTLGSIGEFFYINPIPGAQRYQYEITDGGGFIKYGFSHSSKPNSTWFSFNLVPGILPSSTYTVRVRVKLGHVWGTYGPPCDISTPASKHGYAPLFADALGEALGVSVFPNPTRGATYLAVSGPEEATTVNVYVRNITGQQVYQSTETVAHGAIVTIDASEAWPAGIYMVGMQSGDTVVWSRLVVD